MSICVHGKARGHHEIASSTVIRLVEKRHLTDPGDHLFCLAAWPVSSRDPPVWTASALCSQAHANIAVWVCAANFTD